MKSAILPLLLLLPLATSQGDFVELKAKKKRKRFSMDSRIAYEEVDPLAKMKLVEIDENRIVAQREGDERAASAFKIPRNGKDEILELPDRASVLKFKTFADFAREEDVEGMMEMRENTWWGRVYVDGAPVNLQFFRGHYGTVPPIGDVTLLLADPIYMCDFVESKGVMNNVEEIKANPNTFVITRRGNCTFGEKSLYAEEMGAKGIIFVNDQPENMHPPAPDVRDLVIASTMLNNLEGEYLISALESNLAHNQKPLTARFVPVACVEEPKNLETASFCEPVLKEEREVASSEYFGGFVTGVGEERGFEYALAEFGMPIMEGKAMKVRMPPVNTTTNEISDGCDDYVDEADIAAIDGNAIIVARGGCDFYNKTVHLANAGAAAIIVRNVDNSITRMGVSPRWKGLDFRIPMVMVGEADGAEIGELDEVTFTRSKEVDLDSWVLIGELKEGRVEGTSVAKYKGKRYWPSSKKKKKEKLAQFMDGLGGRLLEYTKVVGKELELL